MQSEPEPAASEPERLSTRTAPPPLIGWLPGGARARRNAAELQRLDALRRDGRLLEVDYPYRPRVRPWATSPALQRLRAMLDARRADMAALLRSFGGFADRLAAIPVQPPAGADPRQPHWQNGFFPGLDAISLYCLLAQRNPRWFVEVGSGNSTRFAARAIQDHGLRTQIVSIDPDPRVEVEALCHRSLRQPLEDVDPAFFAGLQADDVLFVDNSHRGFQSSDVTVFFTEVLPQLPPGMLYGLHDIHLPDDYPQHWLPRFYNEQYFLLTWLLAGADGDRIALANAWVTTQPDLHGLLQPILGQAVLRGVEAHGGLFWLERRPTHAGA